MRIELKREHILIIPDSDQDMAFIEDSLGFTRNGDSTTVIRVDDVSLGFTTDKKYVLKIGKTHAP